MYTLQFTNKALKGFKRLPRDIKAEIVKRSNELVENPLKGSALNGELREYRSYHFSFRSVQYRIIYKIYPEEQLINVIKAGTRENIYEHIK